MRGIIKRLRIIVTFVICAGLLWFGVTGYMVSNSKAKMVITSSSIIDSVKEIAEFSTIEYNLQTVMDFESTKRFSDLNIPLINWLKVNVPGGHKTYLIIVKGKIKAGVNLAQMTEDDIEIKDKSITLTLPRASVLSKEIDMEKSRVYHEKDGVFNRIKVEDVRLGFEEALKVWEQEAIDEGIIEKSEENARVFLTKLLRTLGFEEIIFNQK